MFGYSTPRSRGSGTRCVSWYIYSDFIRTYINTDIMFGYSTPRSRGSGTRSTRCVSWYIYSDFIRTYINTDIMFGYSTPRSRGSGTRSTLGVYRGIFIVILYVHTLTQTLCSATPHPGVVDLALGVYRGIFIVILYVHTLTQTLCSATPHPGVVDLALGVYRGIFIVIVYSYMVKDYPEIIQKGVPLPQHHRLLFLILPASAPRLVYQRPWYVLSCLWDDAYKRTLAAYRKE